MLVLLLKPEGLLRLQEHPAGMKADLDPRHGRTTKLAALVVAALLAVTFPLWAGDQYQLHLAALIAAFWVLIGGLNLVVGYTGQLSIGHVGLLAVGAYTFAILAGTQGVHPALAVAAAGALCGLFGLLLGLPSLRLPGFYFAMATMAVALIVGEFIMANDELTGGGIGLAVPAFPPPFDSPAGFYYLVLALAAWSPGSPGTWRARCGGAAWSRSATARSPRRRSACRCSARS